MEAVVMETEQLVTALVVAVMALGKTVMEAEERVQVEGETVLVKQAMAVAQGLVVEATVKV
jgi:hypothetical protein